jgi:hypothetical protein
LSELNPVFAAVERTHEDESASTRRQVVAGAAATLGGLGMLAMAPKVMAHTRSGHNAPQTILNVAVTAEVLATIVNTIGWERGLGGDRVTQRNIKAAAREELEHYKVLRSVGGEHLADPHRIWVPDAVFANRTNFLSTLEVGDQIFVNAYLIATLAWGNAGNGRLATIAAEFMGVEAVHRALARQSLGKLGNDRVFMKFDQRETAPDAPNKGQPGFDHIMEAVRQLQAAGFGFDAPGARPGRFYDFREVRRRTPTDPDLNTFRPDAD